MDTFDRAFEIVVGVEGNYVNDPADPGGETKFGISKRSYPDVDIAALTLDEAKAIHRRDFWDPYKCGDMPWRWALAIYDTELNQGSRAVAWAQEAEGIVEDGIVGGMTLAAMNGQYNDDLFDAFMAIRLAHYAAGAGYARFGKGWFKRVIHIARAGEHPPS